MQENDDHNGVMKAFKIFDENDGGSIEPKEMITVSQRLESIKPSKLEVNFKIDEDFFKRIANGEMTKNDLIIILIFSLGLLTLIMIIWILVSVIKCCKSKKYEK